MKTKTIALLMVISVAPLICWIFVPFWVPAVLGPPAYEWLDTSSGPVIITIALLLLPFVVGGFIFFGMFFGASAPLRRATRETRRVLATGRPAKAVVKRISESSLGATVTINDQPYLNLTLEIHDEYSDPYVVSFDTIVPRAEVPQVQPGAEIAVKVDPMDPEKVAIVWS
ncbi:MAG: hypothetical protein JSW52_06775 [Candidatus Coatesbacteria bacterium]|nr:MAG: hypothetical protein JSW52_06775 [Candidatus Coatesbacteria bacterium]